MVVMYPLTVQHDYTEFRFSLRSIDKYLKPDEVVIVGDYVPEWINNVTNIELPDVPGRKRISIKRKILAALEYTDKIFFLADDVYLLQTPDFKYYSDGLLKGISDSGSKPLIKQLEALRKTTFNFNVHGYIVYEKEKFNAVPFTEECMIKSGYCNFHSIEPTEINDFKVHSKRSVEEISEKIQGRPFFSTSNGGIKYALPVLDKLFPVKSKYEI